MTRTEMLDQMKALTEAGRIDEAVAIMQALAAEKADAPAETLEQQAARERGEGRIKNLTIA